MYKLRECPAAHVIPGILNVVNVVRHRMVMERWKYCPTAHVQVKSMSDGSCDTVVLSRIAVRVWHNVDRVMHDHLSPFLILMWIISRPTNIVRSRTYSYPHTSYLYAHWVPPLSDFVPLRKDQHPLWAHIKPVVRAIEVSYIACKYEFRRNPRSHSWRFFISQLCWKWNIVVSTNPLSVCFFDHVSSNISDLWLLLCSLRIPFHQLASPPELHVIQMPKGNLVLQILNK